MQTLIWGGHKEPPESYRLPMGVGARVARTRDAVERACATADTAEELLDALEIEIQRAIPHDGSIWFGLDPVTMLATAPSRVEGMDAGLCDTFWHLEFHEQDSGLFTDLARGEGVSGLHLSLDGRTSRSIRYRECLLPQGYDDELRAVFSAGESTWGAMALYREGIRSPFDADDVAVVRSITGIVADALRIHVRRAVPWIEPSSPGLVVVGECGRIVSANAEALDWLRLLWPMTADGDASGVSPTELLELRDRGIGVPTPLFALVAKARAVAEGRERGPARLRLRDERGRWIVLHGSSLSGPGTNGASVAVVIEGAKSAEVAPIIIDAYSLTPREREVLGAIARGASTAEIAAELFLSSHTVRDYVKTVFEKLGVSSRGELVARLFAEHYSDGLHTGMRHVD
jgi:DNA-binding CsgD family transcriptional regulator